MRFIHSFFVEPSGYFATINEKNLGLYSTTVRGFVLCLHGKLPHSFAYWHYSICKIGLQLCYTLFKSGSGGKPPFLDFLADLFSFFFFCHVSHFQNGFFYFIHVLARLEFIGYQIHNHFKLFICHALHTFLLSPSGLALPPYLRKLSISFPFDNYNYN